MAIPAELRRRPPEATLRWVAAAVGPRATVWGVRRLRNSWAAAVHAVDVVDGERRHGLVLRRWVRVDAPPEPGVVAREAAALEALEPSEIAAPRLVAADEDGTIADAPALVMTRLAGRDELAPDDLDGFLRALAATLRSLHAVRVVGLPEYAPWNLDVQTAPPSWTRRPDAWERAIAIANEPMPPLASRLCHRDFHPGNVLWQGGRVTGVVDWVNACTGPAAVDVAHCRLNLALLFGCDAADQFEREYGSVDALPFFDLVDTVGAADIINELWRFHDAGRTDLTREGVIDRVDEFVARAVAASS